MDFPVLLASSPWREVLLDDVELRLVLPLPASLVEVGLALEDVVEVRVVVEERVAVASSP